jgi:hypothetical protein
VAANGAARHVRAAVYHAAGESAERRSAAVPIISQNLYPSGLVWPLEGTREIGKMGTEKASVKARQLIARAFPLRA